MQHRQGLRASYMHGCMRVISRVIWETTPLLCMHACIHPVTTDDDVDAILVSCPCPPPGAEIGTALTYMSRST